MFINKSKFNLYYLIKEMVEENKILFKNNKPVYYFKQLNNILTTIDIDINSLNNISYTGKNVNYTKKQVSIEKKKIIEDIIKNISDKRYKRNIENSKSIKDIKEICSELGLNTQGKKKQLIEKIKRFYGDI